MLKTGILVGLFASLFFNLPAQLIRTEPSFPTENDSVTVIFDASQGSAGLKGYTGDIWAHTGVITNLSTGSTNWKYVIAQWGENTDKAKLKPLGNNLWELKIGPSIRSFFKVPIAEKILKMAFVFRNANGSLTGKSADGSDIFADVFEAGLNVSIIRPFKQFIAVDPGAAIDIQVGATSADSIALFQDGIRRYGGPGTELSYTLMAAETGYHLVEAVAYGGANSARATFNYLVKSAAMIAELPPGVKDGINYIDEHTVTFVLFAPEKEFVFLIGDFESWVMDESYLLKQTPDGQRWWITVDQFEPLREYQFQYLVDGEIRIADPYSDKISDPWNDIYIDETTYPGLIAYPQGKTTEAVSVIQTEQPAYVWKSSAFSPPAHTNLVIYELLIRDFLKVHSFKALTDSLDYLKSLGINAIELMPVSEFEGNDSWGYNPSFSFAVDKYYGPKSTFKAFVDSAHQKGMAVIMDMVLNHVYGQSPLVRLYWDAQNNRPAANNPWFNTVSPNTAYSWGSDFNHASLATQRFVDSVNTYWMQEYHVDGFRFDFTKGFTNTPGDGSGYDAARIAILKRMTDKIRVANPKALVILEHFAATSEEIELSNYGMLLWGNANYSYRQAADGWYSGGQWDFSTVSYKQRGWPTPNLVGYMESHDEERLMYEVINYGNTQNPAYFVKNIPLALKRMELAANFFLTVPGPKMIWMFGELGYDYSINYNGRVSAKPIRWDYYADPLRRRLSQVYSALNHLKTDFDLFQTTDYQVSFKDSVKQIHLNHSTMNATILGNFGIRSSWTDPNFKHDGWWYEYWTGDSLQVQDVNGRMNLQPGAYRLYTDVKLTRPDILSGIGDPDISTVAGLELRVYPNPAANHLFIETGDRTPEVKSLRVLDAQGRVMIMKTDLQTLGTGVIRLEVGELECGLYFVEIQSTSGTRVARWVKSD